MKARNKTVEKDSKKLNRDKIIEKIERERNFQRQQEKSDEYNHTLSKNQRKKLYESLIHSIDKVVKLEAKLGVKSKKSKDYSLYYKAMLKDINKRIVRSQNTLKRIVLVEKIPADGGAD
jgi:hypothetical protein